jgi:hypothetical protein
LAEYLMFLCILKFVDYVFKILELSTSNPTLFLFYKILV